MPECPDEPGPDPGRLRRIAFPDMPHALWRALIDELVRERIVMRNGPWLHLPEHTVTLSDSDRALAQQLQPLIAVGRLDPPWVRDLAAAVHQPEERVRQVLRKQVAQGSGVSGRARSVLRQRIASVSWPASSQRLRRSTAPSVRPAIGMRSGSVASVRSRSWSSSIASVTRAACMMCMCCAQTADGSHGRHTHPVVRLGFKPRRGRQTLPGRFDSCCLPPLRE